MRRTIFDILDKKFNLNNQIQIIEELVLECIITETKRTPFNIFEEPKIKRKYKLEEFFDEVCLPNWKYRNNQISCEAIRKKLEITHFDIKHNLDNNKKILFLEYIYNIINMCEIMSDDNIIFDHKFNILKDNIKNILQYINLEAKYITDDKEKIIFVEKNSAATAVAEIIETQYAFDVIEYNHFLLKGDLERKKQILKNLGDKFEEIRKEVVLINKDLADDTGYLLNNLNIRHNNINGPKKKEYVAKMSNEKLEKWYDETYQKLLLCILTYDNSLKKNDFKELKRNIQS